MKGGGAGVSLSQLSKASPNKRKTDQNSDKQSSGVKPRAILQKGNPDWPCPSPGCTGHIRPVKKKDGVGEFGSCDQRVYGDADSCPVTTTILQPSKDHPKFCVICNSPVGGTPTLGEPTDEKDDRGYTEWNNIHACFNLCSGARTADGKKFKYATTVTSGQDIVDKACYTSSSSTNNRDITKGCTGKIKIGDLVVKAWDSPPLHLYCSKRLWTSTVNGILNTKKVHKELGTTHEEEAAKPSAAVPDAFKHF